MLIPMKIKDSANIHYSLRHSCFPVYLIKDDSIYVSASRVRRETIRAARGLRTGSDDLRRSQCESFDLLWSLPRWW